MIFTIVLHRNPFLSLTMTICQHSKRKHQIGKFEATQIEVSSIRRMVARALAALGGCLRAPIE
jgi:hypothetical protein